MPSDNLPEHDKLALSDNTKLTEAAVSASQSLQRLAQVEQAVHPGAKIQAPPDPKSYGMGELVSIDWSGPIQPIIEKLGNASDYHVKVMGNKPSIPVLVAVNAHNIPLGDILSNVGYQAGNRANVLVYPTTRTIELRYAEA